MAFSSQHPRLRLLDLKNRNPFEASGLPGSWLINKKCLIQECDPSAQNKLPFTMKQYRLITTPIFYLQFHIEAYYNSLSVCLTIITLAYLFPPICLLSIATSDFQSVCLWQLVLQPVFRSFPVLLLVSLPFSFTFMCCMSYVRRTSIASFRFHPMPIYQSKYLPLSVPIYLFSPLHSIAIHMYLPLVTSPTSRFITYI